MVCLLWMDNRRKSRANTCFCNCITSAYYLNINKRYGNSFTDGMIFHMPHDILSYPVERRVVTYAAVYGYVRLGSGYGEDA